MKDLLYKLLIRCLNLAQKAKSQQLWSTGFFNSWTNYHGCFPSDMANSQPCSRDTTEVRQLVSRLEGE